jgi:repressor LexA
MTSFLTLRQKQILDFIEGYQAERGVAPTHRDICEHFGFSSYGTAHKHLRLLREKGFLERQRYQRRGMRVRAPVADDGDQLHEVPFLGRIAAGAPIEAVVGEETLGVPAHLLGALRRDHFVLRVAGSSMVEEGVFDGDLVIVERREVGEPGEMVVALVDGEVTLKRFYPEGELVRLQPANEAMAPIRVAADRVRIQGIVVGLMRKF